MNGRKNSGREYRIRFGIIMLALIMAVTMMPAFAFAQTEPTPEPEAEIIDDNDIEETEESAESAGDDVIPKEDAADAAASDGELTELESVATDEDLPDEAEMLKGYFDKKTESAANNSGSSGMKLRSRLYTRKSTLTSTEQAVYDQIEGKIKSIAAGDMGEAYFSVDHYAGLNYPKVVEALMLDMPYEFYWYDKVSGYLHGLDRASGKHVFYFSVSCDYWNEAIKKETYNLIYGVNTVLTAGTKEAVDNVTGIISKYADSSDIEKLWGYCKEICKLTEYNWDAAGRADAYSSGINRDPFYGDPWQLIYVFDGNEDTDVVCEGYAKAFQYLFNETFDDSSIDCYMVSGELYQNSVDLGGHMWNVIHMGNGGNYLADVTNSDAGTYARDAFFLTGYTGGNLQDGYNYSSPSYDGHDNDILSYEYDNETLQMFSEEELTLSNTDFSDGEPVEYCRPVAPECTSTGRVERWLRLGFYYSDENCTKRFKYAQTIIPALGHSWSGWKTAKAATCTAKGSAERKCSTCGAVSEKVLPALGHSWKVKDTLDKKYYSCSRCGSKKTISKVVVDRPKVTIKKPARAKKGFTVKWKELSKKKRKKISGIEIQYSTRKNFASDYKIRKAKKTAVSKKITKLKRKKTYYVRIRTYKMINGKKHVSKWSKVRKVKTK